MTALYVVEIVLDVNDLNGIKHLTDIAMDYDDTFIHITSDLVRDT